MRSIVPRGDQKTSGKYSCLTEMAVVETIRHEMVDFQTKSLFGKDEVQAEACGHSVRVAFEAAVDKAFDYLVPERLWPVRVGERVEVPLGRSNKKTVGYCIGADLHDQVEGRTLKRVSGRVDAEPLVDEKLMDLALWISSYYFCPLGQVLAAVLPAAVKKGVGVSTAKYIYLAGVEGQSVARAGSRQGQITKMLADKGAVDEQHAVAVKEIITELQCSDASVKTLLTKGAIKLVHRTVMKALPAVPEAFLNDAKNVVLNDEQVQALAAIKAEIDKEEFGVTLLHGVTDSGKTELYIQAIEAVTAKGKGAIVLLPEIALTSQMVERFAKRFERVAVMHSGLTAAQRNTQWQKIKAGEADVVIGARSAIFAPLAKLGLIVVDEEHENSYKQDTAPRYHGRDVAIKRAHLENVHCILGSATPSLESLHNCTSRKHYNLVRLTKRVMDLPMPQMQVVDMREVSERGGPVLLSEQLEKKLGEVLGRGEQAIMLLNRRGYSNFIYCPSCKHTLQCRNCDVTLTFHKTRGPERANRLATVTGKHLDFGHAICHYCLAQTLVPEKCPLCGKKMVMFGLGSQRLEEEIAKKFPQAKVARVDSDSMQSKDYYSILKGFADGSVNILAGTQILAKGLHFPNVTLVGIISADTALYLPDFRANERTFQLISQVAGRAGRSSKKGTVVIQTFMPEQPAIVFATKHDYDGFVQEEIKHRKACNLPPLWRMAIMVLRDESFEKLMAACNAMKEKIDSIIAANGLEVIVRGPMPCTINRIEQYHRMQMIFEALSSASIQKLFGHLRASGPVKPTVKVGIDIDPVNLL